MLALVRTAKRKSLARKATINWDDIIPDVQDTLQQAGERWRKAFVPLIAGVVEDAADHWRTEAGLAFDVRNLEAEAFFIDYTLHFATPIIATSEREIAALLQQGQRDGWSVAQMQTTLTDMFQQWVDGDTDAADFAGERLPPWRAETIARTETVRALNFGSLEIYRSAGVTEKEWLATLDGREREEHAGANGQVVATDDPFIVGGEQLMFPGDPSGSPGNTINCRCTVLPVIAEEEIDEAEEGAQTITLDGEYPPDVGSPGDTLDSLNAFLQESNGALAFAMIDSTAGMLRVDYTREDDYFLINSDVVKGAAAAFVKESQDIKYGREYILQLAREHAEENGVDTAGLDMEALFNRQYAYRAEAILSLAYIDGLKLTSAQSRRLETAMNGDYLNMVYSTESSEAGSLANQATARGGQKLSGAQLREARANFMDWVRGID